MSNSTSNLDLIRVAQAQKETTANELFDAASPAMLYGRQARTSGGLVWGYYGGAVVISGTPTSIANGAITLTASATNYLEADPATGAVSKNTSGWTPGLTPLYSVVCGATTVSSYTDFRTGGGSAGGVSSVNGQSGEVTLTAADVGAIDADAVGAANGVASLGADGKVPAAQLPATTAQPFDIHAFYPGVPSASAKVLRTPVARAVTFPDDFAGSYGIASVAATASTAFDIAKNGTSVGTMTFAAGATTATFVTSGATVALAAGDRISITAPGTADATLADVGIVLAGTR